MTEGDFVFVPPHMPHIEVNMSTTEDLVWLTCRTPDNIVINLPDVEDSVLQGYRRTYLWAPLFWTSSRRKCPLWVKRRLGGRFVMSALPPKADIAVQLGMSAMCQ